MLPLLIMAGAAAAGGIGNYMSSRDAAARYKSAMSDYNSGMQGAIGQYKGATQQAIDGYNLNSQQYLNTPEGVNRWLNPNMDYQLEQVANANNQQYASGGKMNSGAAMKALQDRSQNVAKLSWQDAFNNMNASNSQGLSNLQYGTNNQLGMASNLFNANQGMYANRLSGAMGQPTAGVGSFLSGFSDGLGAGAGAVNAMSGAKK